MIPVEVTPGDSPVILGLPHTGTWLPDDIRARLNARGQVLADTDWHIERLYDGLLPGATTVRATFHRYVIDANRGARGHRHELATVFCQIAGGIGLGPGGGELGGGLFAAAL
mgnify:CR=1 FL=1